MDELEKTAQETAEETGGMAPDAGEQENCAARIRGR